MLDSYRADGKVSLGECIEDFCAVEALCRQCCGGMGAAAPGKGLPTQNHVRVPEASLRSGHIADVRTMDGPPALGGAETVGPEGSTSGSLGT